MIENCQKSCKKCGPGKIVSSSQEELLRMFIFKTIAKLKSSPNNTFPLRGSGTYMDVRNSLDHVLKFSLLRSRKYPRSRYCPEIERDWNLKWFYPTHYKNLNFPTLLNKTSMALLVEFRAFLLKLGIFQRM